MNHVQMLAEGLEHHRAGRPEQAAELYSRVLEQDPQNADALHLSGMLAFEAGDFQKALGMLGRAVRLRPDVAAFHNNLGNVLLAMGRAADASLCYVQALATKPDYVEAHLNLGNALSVVGLNGEAEAHYRRALWLRPGLPEAHNNLANSLVVRGRFEEAEAEFREALRLKPGYAEAWLNLSGALKGQEKLEEAEQCCRQALLLVPGMAEAYSNLAAVFSAAGRHQEAEQAAQEALARNPSLAEPWVALAAARQAQGAYGEAERCARQALALRPGYAEAENNLGNALLEQGRLEEAEAHYREAIRRKPGLADAHYNLGNALRAGLRLEEACGAYQEAIRIRGDHVKAHWNLALTLLLGGRLEEGFREFEWRWKKKDTPPRLLEQPLWDGSPLAGRTLLLHAEQGLGDTIQFSRYAKLARNSGGRVVLECPAKLAALLATVPGVNEVLPQGAPPPPFDVHAPLGSLPGLCGTTLNNIPAATPYLKVAEEFRRKWRQRLGTAGGRRIGLVWAGNPLHAEDARRSCSLEALAPLARVAGVRWCSLQFGERAAEAARPPQGWRIEDLSGETADFRDAAAALEQLDLLISVDTAMAHLAGALARPVWLLLAYVPDWRWLLGREDTPWYPTMRLFRQPRPGDWASVVDAVVRALK